MKKNTHVQQLFDKYLQNKCTSDELMELLDLLQHCEDQELDGALSKLWEIKRSYAVDTAQVNWKHMLSQIKQSQPENHNDLHEPINVKPQKRWYSYAAAAAVVIFSMGYYFWNVFPYGGKAMAEVVTALVKRDTINLADGSRVILNAGSKLRYPKIFDGDTREVYLEGEGYFDVSKDATKPFIVHAGQLKTKVLGTSFNINAYKGQSKMEVTVVTGKVEVEETKSGRIVDLLPDEKVQFTHVDNQFRKILKADVKKAIVWSTGRLAFEDAPLADIVQQYYRRYGRKVEIEGNGLKNCRLSLVFDQESPEEVLDMIKTLTNAQMKEDNGILILYGSGCSNLNDNND